PTGLYILFCYHSASELPILSKLLHPATLPAFQKERYNTGMFTKQRHLLAFSSPVLIAITLLAGITSPPVMAAATPRSAVRLSGGERCFDSTGKCMHGIFLGYWQSHGGLTQFGYPV